MSHPEAPRVRLRPATLALLDALEQDRDAFAALLGSPAPDGWPEFPEAIGFTRRSLRERPEASRWTMQLFLDAGTGALVGSGGYVGVPRDGVIEIGYEVAPAFRGSGYGTAGAAALVEHAVDSGEVTTVLAHTLPEESASTRVLARLGFAHTADTVDPEAGPVWEWTRRVDPVPVRQTPGARTPS